MPRIIHNNHVAVISELDILIHRVNDTTATGSMYTGTLYAASVPILLGGFVFQSMGGIEQ